LRSCALVEAQLKCAPQAGHAGPGVLVMGTLQTLPFDRQLALMSR
jgi:hypothetical protein